MKTSECLREMAASADRAAVVCSLGSAASGWWTVTRSDEAAYLIGAMGLASSFGLGLALSAPAIPVWVLEGDGAFCMNLGSTLTAARVAPPNLTHFILINRAYHSVHDVPLTVAEGVDLAEVYRAAGAARVVTVASLQQLRETLADLARAPAFAVVALQVEDDLNTMSGPPLPFEGPEMKYRFGRALERRFGLSVFGPEGY